MNNYQRVMQARRVELRKDSAAVACISFLTSLGVLLWLWMSQ